MTMRINSGHAEFWSMNSRLLIQRRTDDRCQMKAGTVKAGLQAALLSLVIGLSGCAQLGEIADADSAATDTTTDSADAVASPEAPVTADDVAADAAIASDGDAQADAATEPAEEVTPPSINPYLASEPVLSAMAKAKFDAALAKAKAAQSEAEVAAAIKAFEAVLAEQADLSGARVNLAQLYRMQGQTDTAMTQLKQAVKDNPNNLDGWNLLGVLQREQGDFTAAEQSYLEALQRWNDYAPAHRNIGILYELYMGRFNDALTHYEAYQALQEKPERRVKGWILLLQRRIDAGEGVDSAVPSEPEVAGEGA
ncbi:tetratricopeptide repeat protein [Corallincola spongiicola]|uniref:Tetratricopeptide repeat protein n=2 Tax=Corallincola spongiicola TaxID=2520508 RepID=A0ABY1WNF4_9GAMM|nr:tetratricopeptide repeat protein [Corallincola spongiicola]